MATSAVATSVPFAVNTYFFQQTSETQTYHFINRMNYLFCLFSDNYSPTDYPEML